MSESDRSGDPTIAHRLTEDYGGNLDITRWWCSNCYIRWTRGLRRKTPRIKEDPEGPSSGSGMEPEDRLRRTKAYNFDLPPLAVSPPPARATAVGVTEKHETPTAHAKLIPTAGNLGPVGPRNGSVDFHRASA